MMYKEWNPCFTSFSSGSLKTAPVYKSLIKRENECYKNDTKLQNCFLVTKVPPEKVTKVPLV